MPKQLEDKLTHRRGLVGPGHSYHATNLSSSPRGTLCEHGQSRSIRFARSEAAHHQEFGQAQQAGRSSASTPIQLDYLSLCFRDICDEDYHSEDREDDRSENQGSTSHSASLPHHLAPLFLIHSHGLAAKETQTQIVKMPVGLSVPDRFFAGGRIERRTSAPWRARRFKRANARG